MVYSFKDGAFVPVPPQDNTVTLFEYEGTSIHKDCPEAKEQQATIGFEGKYSSLLIFYALCCMDSGQEFRSELGVLPKDHATQCTTFLEFHNANSY